MPADISAIKTSWTGIKEALGENGPETVGRLVFENLFKEFPYMMEFFKHYGSSAEEMMNNKKFMWHAKDRVFVTFDKIIQALGNEAEIKEIAVWLAKVHGPKRVKTQDLLNLGSAILTTLEQALGPDMTPELKKEWNTVLVELMTAIGSLIKT